MLTQEEIEQYRESGYLLVKGLLDPQEAKALREECHDLARRRARDEDLTWASARDMVEGSKPTMLTHCPNVQLYSAALGKLLLDDRFTAVAAGVMGVPNVQLHHTKMFIKPPENGSPFPMHQDYPFFPHTTHSVAAAIFHFDDAPVEKGCVRVVPGSNRRGPLQHEESGGSYYLPFDEYPLETAIPCPAEAGDALFFNYLTVHGSGVNVSNEDRTTVLIQFRDPEDQPTVAVHVSPGQGVMLRGIDPNPQ